MWSGGIDPIVLYLGTKWKCVISLAHRSLYFLGGKSLWYPLYSRFGGPQGRSGRFSVVENFSPEPYFEPRLLGHPTGSFFTVPTELDRLRKQPLINRNVNFTICVYITNYLHFFTMFLSF